MKCVGTTFSDNPLSLFAAAEEFSHLMDDNAGSKFDMVGSDAMANKDNASKLIVSSRLIAVHLFISCKFIQDFFAFGEKSFVLEAIKVDVYWIPWR